MPSKRPLTKSYYDRRDPKYPTRDITLYQLWDEAKRNGFVGNILNLETGERMTNLQLLDLGDKFAKGLLALGFKPGEGCVAVIGCPSLYAGVGLYVAATALGVAFAHPYIFSPHEVAIENTFSLVGCKLVVVGEGNDGVCFSALMKMFDSSSQVGALRSEKLPFVEHIFYDDTYRSSTPTQNFLRTLDKLIELGETISDEQLSVAKGQVKPEHLFVYTFSSGSTGLPKCIARTQKSCANATLIMRCRNLPVILQSNVNTDEMIGIAFASLLMIGAFRASVMSPDIIGSRSAEEFGKLCTEAILSERVGILGIIPGMQQMVATYARHNNIKLPKMKYSLYGGQVISRGFKEKLLSIFGGRPVTGYGMSEVIAMGIVSFKDTPEQDENRLNSVLYPPKNSEMRIVDENGEVVDIGEDGEIQIKNPTMLCGYQKQDDLFKRFITEDGFARTGDMGVMRSDGGFIIKGRMVDVMRFKVVGKVIYPTPIEEALGTHPSILDIQVVSGQRNDWMGDEVTYCICLTEGAKEIPEEELVQYSLDHGLTEQYNPCRIIYFDVFPRTANSRKVSKQKIREQVAEKIKNDPLIGITQTLRKRAEKMGATLER